MVVPALIAVLAASQAEPQETQTEMLQRLKWELQELKTDEEWKPEKRGVDEILLFVA